MMIGSHRIRTRDRSNAVTSPGSWPTLLLDVPLVGQRLSDECWYASACMVAYFRAPGPRLGLPGKWKANKGITPDDFVRLAQVEGLQKVRLPSGTHAVDKFGIYRWLLDHGPLWCAGYWYGVGHIIVLTGIAGDTIHFNDPDDQKGGDEGRRATESVAWFNEKLAWDVPGCLMFKPA